jgi:putative membrane protein
MTNRPVARPAIAQPPTRKEAIVLVTVVVVALGWSGLSTNDHLTWCLEVVWIVLALPLLVANWQRFPLTRLLCWLLAAHALVLIHGGTYTYAQTPLGFGLRDLGNALGLDVVRNPWDRVGHVMQGFVPAILARELLLRLTPLQRGGWLVYLVLAACLSFSALFELIEWWAALAFGADADAFLATQGDQWDTQWDMFLCLCGATLSLLLWSRLHDRQLGVAAD